MKKRIYLDYASSTPLATEVRKAMGKTEKEIFGNPSAIHGEGKSAKEVLENARKKCAMILQVKSDEITFTSSATESNNLAILGTARKQKKGHIITSVIEHKSVLEVCKQLEREGFLVTYLPVDENGLVSVNDIEKAFTDKTILVSIMYANNEIGTIQAISDIGRLLKKHPNIMFHTDAAQCPGALSLVTEKFGVHLLSLNGEKIYGPKGIGLLYVKMGVAIEPILFGGGQEKSIRSGTENVIGAVGLAEALEIAEQKRKSESKRLIQLRDYAIREILKIDGAELNGHPKKRLPNNINISFRGIGGEKLVMYLDNEGIAASTGSACTEKSVEPSHVITALGRKREEALSSVRFTLGRETSKKEIETFLKILNACIDSIRRLT